MIAKLLTAGLTSVLALVVVRQLIDRQEKARVRVRSNRKEHPATRLNRDPETGIYRPED